MKKTVLVSDLSGAEIEDGKGATVSINFRDDPQLGGITEQAHGQASGSSGR